MPTARKNTRGSITLVALCLAIVLGISLSSYIALCYQSLQLSTRTMHLSRARQLAETGLEEALWALNNANWGGAGPNVDVAWSGSPTTQETCTLPGPSVPAGYNLGNGAFGTLQITVNFTAPHSVDKPVITSTAVVTVPGMGQFTKTLAATTKPAPLFVNALGVINGSLTLPAGTVIDSWDSDYNPAAVSPTPYRDYNTATSPVLYSTVSPLPAASSNPANYSAVVAAPTITLNGDATIYGYTMTNGNLINTSANCIIKGPSTPALTKIDRSRVGKSAFMPAFTVTPPSPPSGIWNYLPTNATWGGSQTIGSGSLTTPQYWTTNANEPGMTNTAINASSNDLSLDGTKELHINGYVILLIDEDFELKDAAKIIVESGSRLEMYVRDDVFVYGTAGFVNNTGEPKNAALFCTSQFSGNFTANYSSPASFNGVIYTIDNNEGLPISGSPEIYGAILAGYTPIFSGSNQKIHYDTALQYLPKGWFKGVSTPYLIEQLNEI